MFNNINITNLYVLYILEYYDDYKIRDLFGM